MMVVVYEKPHFVPFVCILSLATIISQWHFERGRPAVAMLQEKEVLLGAVQKAALVKTWNWCETATRTLTLPWILLQMTTTTVTHRAVHACGSA